MPSDAVLEKCPPGYRLDVNVDSVDAGRFVRENTSGAHAAAARRSAAATATATVTLEGTGGRVRDGLRAGLAARLNAITGETHSVTDPATSIGRSSESGIVLIDARVSRRRGLPSRQPGRRSLSWSGEPLRRDLKGF